ncbi:metal-dependent hydrolase [Sphingomonas sp. BN140010]|uniref:Metal-dependent hydrolase n=1 Tax=Sphingomonas arvum TaxID=2992113 RepID=A0ABT3JBV3_9SPHN|nr:metal-dependent hydrolase [Sphingomonas sp. BN140010]MCW3796539.1 metal-dependent hydrolase [Sphingomonas sp. BN140010]
MNVATLKRTTPTPADLTITPRDLRFGRDEQTARWWLNGDPYQTAIYNALSATFPKGEANFIESVRAFRDHADERLAGEIRAFTTQEVIHSREHLAFNKRATDAGYDLSPLEQTVDESLEQLHEKPPIAWLMSTMCLEHFTAIIAHELLANPRHLAGADQATADMWRWHAVEEVEHKGVAYDTWLAVTKGWPRFKRWKLKSMMMLLVTKNFVEHRTAGAMELLRQDGLTGRKVKLKLLWALWGKPGIFRKVGAAWLKFFLPGFHPWNEDDRELIKGWEQTYPYLQVPPKKRVRSATPA